MRRARVLVAMLIAALMPGPAPAQTASPPVSDKIARGTYIATLGDCTGCHTAPGGEPFAGGLPLNTPFGTIFVPNITPDKETGIGDWTDDQFYRALHDGIDDEGAHLYPAFPYVYFSRIPRADADALHAYLQTLSPVRKETPPDRLPFPLSWRYLITFWNAMNFDHTPAPQDAAKSPAWNRGAYIVSGPGHCGACHTPKNWLGGDRNDQAYRGNTLDNWFAADLTGDTRSGLGAWSQDDITEYLKTGRNRRATASGSMQDVVEHSTSQMSDDDRAAIAAYLKDLPAGGGDAAAPAPATSSLKVGEAIFTDACSACHRSAGGGEPEYFPPLKGDSGLQASDATTLVRIILEGSRSRPTDARPTALTMPAFGWKLSDTQIADVASYVRNSWGNRAPAVDAAIVAKIRKAITPANP